MVPTAALVVQNFWNVTLILLLHLGYPGFSEGYSLKLLDPEKEVTTFFLTWVTLCLSLRRVETFIHFSFMTINFEAIGSSEILVTIYQSTWLNI